MVVGRLLKTSVLGAVGQYVYEENGQSFVTRDPNDSIIHYILHFLMEKLPIYNERNILYSWVYPTIDPEQELSLQTPSVAMRLVSKVHRTLGRYITDIKGNIARGYLFDGLIEIQVIDTSDYDAQALSYTIDNLLLRDGGITGLFDYLVKQSFADEQGFSDTFKLNFPTNYRTPSEQQYVYRNRYGVSYLAETALEEDETIFNRLAKINANIGVSKSNKKYLNFSFKVVEDSS